MSARVVNSEHCAALTITMVSFLLCVEVPAPTYEAHSLLQSSPHPDSASTIKSVVAYDNTPSLLILAHLVLHTYNSNKGVDVCLCMALCV
jgi:hypothetical protein